jgi:hypothetical protein
MEESSEVPIKVMIISMGGPRREALEKLVNLHSETIEAVFVPGVPSRGLRSRQSFASYCHQAGLLPEAEWEAVREGDKVWEHALATVPKPTATSATHYLMEMWYRSKALSRDRAVLACTFAHLIALKQFVQDGTFDAILEDNVRWNQDSFGQKLRQIQRAKQLYELENGTLVHMQYYGWLGSVPNLRWAYGSHIPKRGYAKTIVPFPDPQDIAGDLNSGTYTAMLSEGGQDRDSREPGGNPVWGAYGYWISAESYDTVMTRLRLDIGSMLWKGKRQRCYQVKPIDKFLPRIIRRAHGNSSVQLCVRPALFRAPMLTSKIHTKFDPEFCKSTTLQLALSANEDWSCLALTETERTIVAHWEDTGEWITSAQLEQHCSSRAQCSLQTGPLI